MIDTGTIDRYRLASKTLSGLVSDELASFFGALNLNKPEAVRNALLEFVPLLVSQYGSVAETLAMDYYDELRGASGAIGAFTAGTAPSTVPAARVEAKVRSLAGQLWTPNPGSMLGGLIIATDKYVQQAGRDTVSHNSGLEGVGWARVPSGSKTCSWCLILASRDAIYASKESAGGPGHRFHGLCDCQPVRIGPHDDYPPGYLPDNYFEIYQTSRDAAGSGSMKDITAAMRREFPDLVNDGVHAH